MNRVSVVPLIELIVCIHPEKESIMERSRFIGGLLLIVAAALLFLFGGEGMPLPVPIALGIVGIALVAVSRRRLRDE